MRHDSAAPLLERPLLLRAARPEGRPKWGAIPLGPAGGGAGEAAAPPRIAL